jgi:hypothetical protein
MGKHVAPIQTTTHREKSGIKYEFKPDMGEHMTPSRQLLIVRKCGKVWIQTRYGKACGTNPYNYSSREKRGKL